MPAASPARPSATRGPLVNFTGNWLLDVEASHGLEPLLAYHGLALTRSKPAPSAAATHTSSTITTTVDASGEIQQTTSTSSTTSSDNASVADSIAADSLFTATPVVDDINGASTTGTQVSSSSLPSVAESSASAESSRKGSTATSLEGAPAPLPPPTKMVPTSSIPALIIQHSVRQLTTYLHALIPRYSPTGELLRYDPGLSGKLTVHEEFRLDGKYHSVATPRGMVQARAYHAPHGQSLVVDQRCASKYDLERTERFLEEGGKKMVMEIRILSCAPDAQQQQQQQTPAAVAAAAAAESKGPAATGGKMVVKEVLFLRRVFTRIVDANPEAAAADGGSTGIKATRNISSAALKTEAVEEEKAEEEEKAAAVVAETQAPTPAVPSNSSATTSATATSSSSGGVAAVLPLVVPRTQLPPAAIAILPTSLTQGNILSALTHTTTASASATPTPTPSSSSSSSSSSSLGALLYPRGYVLKRYQLRDILPQERGSGAPTGALSESALAERTAREHVAYSKARGTMGAIDLLLLALLLLLLLHQLGLCGWHDDDGHDQEVHKGALQRGAAAMVAWIRERLMPQADAMALVPVEVQQ